MTECKIEPASDKEINDYISMFGFKHPPSFQNRLIVRLRHDAERHAAESKEGQDNG